MKVLTKTRRRQTRAKLPGDSFQGRRSLKILEFFLNLVRAVGIEVLTPDTVLQRKYPLMFTCVDLDKDTRLMGGNLYNP